MDWKWVSYVYGMPMVVHRGPRPGFFVGILRPTVGNTAGTTAPFPVHCPTDSHRLVRSGYEWRPGCMNPKFNQFPCAIRDEGYGVPRL